MIYKKIFLLSFMAFMFFGECYAQARLQISTSTSNYRLDRTSYSVTILNCGDMDSEELDVTLWVSLDDKFDEDDGPVKGGEDFIVPKKRPNYCGQKSVTKSFNLPHPPDMLDPENRLYSDSFTAHQWLGRKIYFRVCYQGRSTARVCSNKDGEPARFFKVISPRAKMINTRQINSERMVELTWLVPPKYEGLDLESHYSLTYRNYAISGEQTTEVIAKEDLQIIERDGERYFRHVFEGVPSSSGITPGTRILFYADACTDVVNGGVGLSAPQCLFDGQYLGLVYGNFAASRGTVDKAIDVAWQKFATSSSYVKGYVLRRCEAGVVGMDPELTDNCVEIELRGDITSYRDYTVKNATLYQYRVYPCYYYRNDGDNICDSRYFGESVSSHNSVSTDGSGATNFGYRSLVDDYEDDDTINQAKTVRGSVTQSRSFDMGNDEDWIKLIVETPQSIKLRTYGPFSVDTVISLYDENQELIDFSWNTPGEETRFATLTTEKLDAGVYYAKIAQSTILLPRPKALYYLDIEMEVMKDKILTPILMLLLDDE